VGDHWTSVRLDQLDKTEAGGTYLYSSFGPAGVAVILGYQATPGNFNASVLFSPDGTTWSTRSVRDIAGGPIGEPTSVSVTTSQVVVVAPKPAPGTPLDGTQLIPLITLIGTPPG
jgi:hypothetical protein